MNHKNDQFSVVQKAIGYEKLYWTIRMLLDEKYLSNPRAIGFELLSRNIKLYRNRARSLRSIFFSDESLSVLNAS